MVCVLKPDTLIQSASVLEMKMHLGQERRQNEEANSKPQMRQTSFGTVSEEAGEEKWARGEMSVKEKMREGVQLSVRMTENE